MNKHFAFFLCTIQYRNLVQCSLENEKNYAFYFLFFVLKENLWKHFISADILIITVKIITKSEAEGCQYQLDQNIYAWMKRTGKHHYVMLMKSTLITSALVL